MTRIGLCVGHHGLSRNAWYPRWACDAYRDQLAAAAAGATWEYLDLWDAIATEEFTDSPVHLTPAGAKQLANLLLSSISD